MISTQPGPILDFLDQIDTRAGLQTVTEQIRQHYQLSHVAYQWFDGRGDFASCGTYPTEWQKRYVAQDYVRIDPVLNGGMQRFQPVEWKELDWTPKNVSAYARDAAAYGVGPQGYSIPERGPNGQFSLLTVNRACPDEEWAAFIDTNRRDLILFAHLMNEKTLLMDPHRTTHKPHLLSPREVEAMTFLASGHSRAQTANELSISEHTLRAYIESARFKLGALNTTHAVARALSRGLIVV